MISENPAPGALQAGRAPARPAWYTGSGRERTRFGRVSRSEVTVDATTLQPVSANVIAVLAAAESLSPAERRAVIECLTLGLEDGTPEDEPRPPLSEAWRREITERLAEFDAGRVQAIPWPEVRARWAARSAARG